MPAANLQSLREALETVEGMRRAHSGTYTDWLNGSSVAIENAHVSDFDLTQLRNLADQGHSAEITVNAGFQAHATIDPPGVFQARVSSGDLFSVFSGTELADVEAAYNEDRCEDFLRLCGELPCSIRVTIRAQPDTCGFHWVRTTAALVNPGGQGSWWDTIQGLFRTAAVNRLVIEDAGGQWLTAGGIAIHGPDAQPRQASGYDAEPWQVYRRTWLTDDRNTLPPPPAALPSAHQGLESIAEFLSQVSQALCWAWLATSTQISPGKFLMTLEHSSFLQVDLTRLAPSVGLDDAMRLAEWSTASPDYMRRDSVQQAISAVVTGPGVLFESARRVLKTAMLLLKLAQSGAVAEAFASRRATVQAAVDAARATSDAARGAARSSSDRAFAEIAAGVGIILANSGSLINAAIAHGLILLVAVLAIVTGVTAYAFEYPAARHTLESYERDLSAFGSVVTDEDAKEIKSLASLKQARDDVRRAEIVTAILLVLTFVGLLVGWIAVK